MTDEPKYNFFLVAIVSFILGIPVFYMYLEHWNKTMIWLVIFNYIILNLGVTYSVERDYYKDKYNEIKKKLEKK